MIRTHSHVTDGNWGNYIPKWPHFLVWCIIKPASHVISLVSCWPFLTYPDVSVNLHGQTHMWTIKVASKSKNGLENNIHHLYSFVSSEKYIESTCKHHWAHAKSLKLNLYWHTWRCIQISSSLKTLGYHWGMSCRTRFPVEPEHIRNGRAAQHEIGHAHILASDMTSRL